jgi:hypothetical protein
MTISLISYLAQLKWINAWRIGAGIVLFASLVLQLPQAGFAVAHSDCLSAPDEMSTRIEKSGYRLFYKLAPEEIRVGQPFKMALIVCSPGQLAFDGEVRVDAFMPMHQHGMNYCPEVRKTAPGIFYAEGFLFHMQGHWQFRFELNTNGETIRMDGDHHLK